MSIILRNADGRAEIFTISDQMALVHIYESTQGGSWSNWANLGGDLITIAGELNQDGRLEIFAIGMDNGLWHIWQDTPGGGWTSWASLGGAGALKKIEAVTSGSKIGLLLRDSHNKFMLIKQDKQKPTGWSGFAQTNQDGTLPDGALAFGGVDWGAVGTAVEVVAGIICTPCAVIELGLDSKDIGPEPTVDAWNGGDSGSSTGEGEGDNP